MSSGATVPADGTEQAGEGEPSVSAPPDQQLPENEVTHEEYNPTGTLALILIYFVILAFMWVFMYFVEFLGNEMTVVG